MSSRVESAVVVLEVDVIKGRGKFKERRERGKHTYAVGSVGRRMAKSHGHRAEGGADEAGGEGWRHGPTAGDGALRVPGGRQDHDAQAHFGEPRRLCAWRSS